MNALAPAGSTNGSFTTRTATWFPDGARELFARPLRAAFQQGERDGDPKLGLGSSK